MKVYVIQKQQWSHDECRRECKKLDNWKKLDEWVLVKMILYGIVVRVIVSIKSCKIDEYSGIKNCSCKKLLIGKLVLVCEGEILNTSRISFVDKKVTCKKNNSLFTLFNWWLYAYYY